MNRNSLIEMSGRAMHFATRMTLNKSSDNPLMQTMDFDGMNSDMRKAVERIQSFGMSSVPLPRDEEGGQPQGGGAKHGGDGEKPKGPAAEGIALFLGGQRNHPVIIAIDDRRHRPMGMKPGESAQYDDQGQMTVLRRNGLFLVSTDDDGTGKAPGSAAPAAGKQGEKKERMVSLRHVTKEKQERPKPQQPKGKDGTFTPRQLVEMRVADAEAAKKNEKYKHEGEDEKVNTEVRCTAGRIEFRAGNQVVGYYDKGSQTWFFKGKIGEFELDKESHTVTDRFETIGKTFLGYDGKGEGPPAKVITEDGPAKKTWAKPL